MTILMMMTSLGMIMKMKSMKMMNGEILSGNISLFKACHVQPTALTNGMVPLDIDVTPFDNSKSHKEGVSRTTLEIVNWLGAVIAQSGRQFDESGGLLFQGWCDIIKIWDKSTKQVSGKYTAFD